MPAASARTAQGLGVKVSPSIRIGAGRARAVLGEIKGSGAIQQIWLTTANLRWRDLILRIWWDDQGHPSVEAPVGDFFCSGWNRFARMAARAGGVRVNPVRALQLLLGDAGVPQGRPDLDREPRSRELGTSSTYRSTTRPPSARGRRLVSTPSFRRTNPLPFAEDYTILDGIEGNGTLCRHRTAVGRQPLRLVGRGRDQVLPWMATASSSTICGTGTEDFSAAPPTSTAAWSTTPWTAAPPRVHHALCRAAAGASPRRHILVRQQRLACSLAPSDPIRFEDDSSRVTIQAPMGWRTEKKDRRYLPLQDDIASVAFWYQTLPTRAVPATEGPRLPRGDLII